MEAIKPRQIINYDAGIVLIDPVINQRKKQLQTIQISDTEYGGNPHVNEEQNPQEQPATSALTK